MENTERKDADKCNPTPKLADSRDHPLSAPVAITPLARVESILSRRSSAVESAQLPSDIEQAATYESSSDDDDDNECEEDDVVQYIMPVCEMESEHNPAMDERSDMNNIEKRQPYIVIVKTPWDEFLDQALYISAFSIFGTIFRIYMARIFGQDCELKQYNEALLPQDFLSPFSSRICITNSGKYTNGGALFVDLPANMLGSFVMGVLSPPTSEHPLPWFHSEHPLQQHTSFHLGLKVGLCGCLTTCKCLRCAK
jgi:fluoride ion exporter CrcB/FEX